MWGDYPEQIYLIFSDDKLLNMPPNKLNQNNSFLQLFKINEIPKVPCEQRNITKDPQVNTLLVYSQRIHCRHCGFCIIGSVSMSLCYQLGLLLPSAGMNSNCKTVCTHESSC